MLEQLKNNQQLFYEQAILPLSIGRVNHAYLIETNNNDESVINNYVSTFYTQLLITSLNLTNNRNISKEKLITLLKNNNYPDLLEIKPVNNSIKKEQILELMKVFSNQSIYGTYQIYVIYQAEMLNPSAANTILKFLEEPEKNIIAILLTNNRYKMLPTILSRCSVITLKHEEEKLENVNDNLVFTKFLNNLITKSNSLILNFNDYYENLFETKEIALLTLKKIVKIFQYYIKNNNLDRLNIKSNDIVLSKFQLLEMINTIDEFSHRLQYNVNIKLWLDSLLIKLMEVKNGNYCFGFFIANINSRFKYKIKRFKRIL